MADQKEQPATRLGQRADPPFMVQPPGCWYTPDEVGRMLGNRVVQPHYAAWLVRKAIETAALRAAPDGFVLVPVEPTPNMKSAASKLFARCDAATPTEFYRAMLAARPQGVR